MRKSNSSRSGWKTWSSAKRSALGGRAVEVLALAAQEARQTEGAADLVDVALVVDLKERVLLLGVGERAQLDLRAPAVAGARAVRLEDEDLVEVRLALEVLLDEALDARHRRLGDAPARHEERHRRHRLVLEVEEVDLLHLPRAEDGEQRAHQRGTPWGERGEWMAKWSSSVAGPSSGLAALRRAISSEDAARRARDHRGIAERLEVHALGGLHLHVAAHAPARTHGVEAHRRDACSLGDLHRLPDRAGAAARCTTGRRRAARGRPAVAKHLPEGVARDLEVLARAAAQVDEAVVEAGEVEEGIEPCPLDAREPGAAR